MVEVEVKLPEEISRVAKLRKENVTEEVWKLIALGLFQENWFIELAKKMRII